MITKIGIAAGEIWHHLDSHGRTKLEDIFSDIDKPRDVLLMSIGWLAREGHVLLLEEDQGHTIELRRV